MSQLEPILSTASYPPLQKAQGRGTHGSEREERIETPKGEPPAEKLYSVPMNLKAKREGKPNVLLGVVFHSVFAFFGGLGLGLPLGLAVELLSRRESSQVQALSELVPFAVSGALVAVFATRRFYGRSAPWVGLLGLTTLFMGWQELWFGWSPTWSHQTRIDYVLSQLFGLSSGCSDSECLYMLFFTFPFVCLTAYSLAALITLRFIRSELA